MLSSTRQLHSLTKNIGIIRSFSLKKKNSFPVVHQADRIQNTDDIDFSALNLKFPLTKDPQYIVQRYLWSQPPETLPDLPFLVERTSTGGLPIYTDIRTGRTRVETLVRNISGDVQSLKDDLEKVVGVPVEMRPGKLVVRGNYSRRVKRWLTGLGF